jgi:hypothetical protein
MKDINFLPDSFLNRQRQRHDRVFLGGSAVTTVLIISAATALLCTMRQSVIHESRSLDSRVAEARAKQVDFAATRDSLEQQERRAALLAYLGQSWPPSRILAEITTPLPSQIALISLSYDRDDSRSNQTTANPFDGSQQDTEAPSESPYEHDLAQLRELCESSPWVISIAGETSDAAVLHLFVHKLSSSKLFAAVELQGFRASTGESGDTQEFTLRLTVAAGHGTDDGERIPLPKKSDIDVGEAPYEA